MKFLIMLAFGLAMGQDANWDASGTDTAGWEEPPMDHKDSHGHTLEHYCPEGERQEHHCRWNNETHHNECHETCVKECHGVQLWVMPADEKMWEESRICVPGGYSSEDGHCEEGFFAVWAESVNEHGHHSHGQFCVPSFPKPGCPAGSMSTWGQNGEVCISGGEPMDCHGFRTHQCHHGHCAHYCITDGHKAPEEHRWKAGDHEHCEWSNGQREHWDHDGKHCVQYGDCGEGMTMIDAEQVTPGEQHWWGPVCVTSHPQPFCPEGMTKYWSEQDGREMCAKVGKLICEDGFRAHHCVETPEGRKCGEFCIKGAEKEASTEEMCEGDHCDCWEQFGEGWNHFGRWNHEEQRHEEGCRQFHGCAEGKMGVWGGKMEGEQWWDGRVCVASQERPKCPPGQAMRWDDRIHRERCVGLGHPITCDGFKVHVQGSQYCIPHSNARLPEELSRDEGHNCDWSIHGMHHECHHDEATHEHRCFCITYADCGEDVKTWGEKPNGSHGPICLNGHARPSCPDESHQTWKSQYIHGEDGAICVHGGETITRRHADVREVIPFVLEDLKNDYDYTDSVDLKHALRKAADWISSLDEHKMEEVGKLFEHGFESGMEELAAVLELDDYDREAMLMLARHLDEEEHMQQFENHLEHGIHHAMEMTADMLPPHPHDAEAGWDATQEEMDGSESMHTDGSAAHAEHLEHADQQWTESEGEWAEEAMNADGSGDNWDESHMEEPKHHEDEWHHEEHHEHNHEEWNADGTNHDDEWHHEEHHEDEWYPEEHHEDEWYPEEHHEDEWHADGTHDDEWKHEEHNHDDEWHHEEHNHDDEWHHEEEHNHNHNEEWENEDYHKEMHEATAGGASGEMHELEENFEDASAMIMEEEHIYAEDMEMDTTTMEHVDEAVVEDMQELAHEFPTLKQDLKALADAYMNMSMEEKEIIHAYVEKHGWEKGARKLNKEVFKLKGSLKEAFFMFMDFMAQEEQNQWANVHGAFSEDGFDAHHAMDVFHEHHTSSSSMPTNDGGDW